MCLVKPTWPPGPAQAGVNMPSLPATQAQTLTVCTGDHGRSKGVSEQWLQATGPTPGQPAASAPHDVPSAAAS